MEAYLKHIYRDLRELEGPYVKFIASDEFSLDEKFSLSQLFCYERINFPPPEFLTLEHMRALARRIETLLSMTSLSAPLPLHLDDDIRYRLFWELWDQKVVEYNEHGAGQLKFCEGILSNCSFGAQSCICGAKFNADESYVKQRKAS